jgi:NAD(P)-dependent dehydrogenase (short-subunit alcohol dehydrogenase family)
MLFDVNVLANIHLFNLFTPLILKGREKKVVTISTGLADLEFTNNFEHEFTPLYSISKAAMNMTVAKFNAQYKKEGVLFMSVCPGMVDVGQFNHGMLLCLGIYNVLIVDSNPTADGGDGGNDGQV